MQATDALAAHRRLLVLQTEAPYQMLHPCHRLAMAAFQALLATSIAVGDIERRTIMSDAIVSNLQRVCPTDVQGVAMHSYLSATAAHSWFAKQAKPTPRGQGAHTPGVLVPKKERVINALEVADAACTLGFGEDHYATVRIRKLRDTIKADIPADKMPKAR